MTIKSDKDMRRYSLHIVLFSLCLLLVPQQVQAQNVSIQAKIDRGEIRTGEQAAIDVVIRTSNLPQTKFYLTEDLRKGEPFVVLEFTPLDTIDIDGRLQEITARMVITSFDSTLITIPPIIVETPDGQAKSSPLALNVIQPEVDAAHPENFKDIKDPWEVSLRLQDIWEMLYRSPIFWAVLCLLVIGALLYRFRDKLKKAPTSEITSPAIITPLEHCLSVLNSLNTEHLREQKDFKTFYSTIIDALKLYMDQEYLWATAEMTSDEVLALLKTKGVADNLVDRLRKLLREADMSKFAKSCPSRSGAEYSLAEAKNFVQEISSMLQPQHNHGVDNEQPIQ